MAAKIQQNAEISNSEGKKNETFFVPVNPLERLNFPVSIVKGNAEASIVKHTTFDEVLQALKSKNTNDVTKSKSLQTFYTTNKKAYNEMKASLYGFIVGRFSYRKDDKCTLYVPVIGFDIDSTKFANLVINDCRNVPYIFAAFPSPSGHGVRILVWCNSTTKTHKRYYESLLQDLSERLNIPTDKQLKAQQIEPKTKEHFDSSTSNLSRFWYYTAVANEDIYLNLESEVYTLSDAEPCEAIERPIERPHKKLPTIVHHSEGEAILTLSERFEVVCRKVNKNYAFIKHHRHEYVYQFAINAKEHGISRNEIINYFLPIIPKESKLSNIKELERQIDSGIMKATKNYDDLQIKKYLNNGAKNNLVQSKNIDTAPGVKETEVTEKLDFDDTYIIEKEQPKILQMKAYLESRYDLKYDIVSNEIEYKRKNETTYKIVNENDLIVELMAVGFKGVEQPLMALLNSSAVRRFDPFVEYFESLPVWNETKPDYIKQLASFVKAKDRVWFDTQFKKMLVRSVAGAIKAIPFNKHCFVLMSSQNDGKSTFLRFLCPPVLKNYIAENIEIDNKDGRIALCQNFIINLDELSKLNKKDVNTIKSFISQDRVKDRLPYGKKAMTFERRANFVGSTNKGEFLIDETGNVRWLIFEIEGIEHDNGNAKGYSRNIDIDLVWSQAYSLFKSKFPYQLTADELRKSETNNTSFRVTTPEMELLQQNFITADENDEQAEFLTATNITERLSLKTTLKVNPMYLGRALTALQFQAKQKYLKEYGYQKKGYYVKEINKM